MGSSSIRADGWQIASAGVAPCFFHAQLAMAWKADATTLTFAVIGDSLPRERRAIPVADR